MITNLILYKDEQKVKLYTLSVLEDSIEIVGQREDGEFISVRLTINDESLKLYSTNKNELFNDLTNWLLTFSSACSTMGLKEMQEVANDSTKYVYKGELETA